MIFMKKGESYFLEGEKQSHCDFGIIDMQYLVFIMELSEQKDVTYIYIYITQGRVMVSKNL